MFFSKKITKLETEKEDFKRNIESLEREKKVLKEQVSDLGLKKKMETENIKHMVKIDREKKDIELEKEKLKVRGEKNKAIAKVKDEYRDKTEAQLEKQVGTMKDMYGEILKRLPNYNVNHNVVESK